MGTTLTQAALCTNGICVPTGTMDCARFCANGACLTACLTDGECDTGAYCKLDINGNGLCTGKQSDGATCSTTNECLSGSCADGVCCNNACTGACTACSAAKKGAGADGVCAPIQTGTDPDNECIGQGAASCGTNGVCDGAGACQKHPSGTLCAPATCWEPTSMLPSSATAMAPACPPAPNNCAPFSCAAGACLATCSPAQPCAPGAAASPINAPSTPTATA